MGVPQRVVPNGVRPCRITQGVVLQGDLPCGFPIGVPQIRFLTSVPPRGPRMCSPKRSTAVLIPHGWSPSIVPRGSFRYVVSRVRSLELSLSWSPKVSANVVPQRGSPMTVNPRCDPRSVSPKGCPTNCPPSVVPHEASPSGSPQVAVSQIGSPNGEPPRGILQGSTRGIRRLDSPSVVPTRSRSTVPRCGPLWSPPGFVLQGATPNNELPKDSASWVPFSRVPLGIPQRGWAQRSGPPEMNPLNGPLCIDTLGVTHMVGPH
jgi:hypothetical protein